MEVLAGDIGGTNTRLALYRIEENRPGEALLESTYPSRNFDSLEAILDDFSEHFSWRIQRACFGIAGPVVNQSCETTNLPWRITARAITDRFGFDDTWLINDLEANAWGISALSPKDFHLLNPGRADQPGNASIVSAGTGLGEAGLYWDGSVHRPFSSEGGHTDFSPSNELEFALYQTLAEKYGHVSWERLVSGPGLEAIHSFLRTYRRTPTPGWLKQEMHKLGGAPAISNAAMARKDPICNEALNLFIHLYGREAGNHALKIMASSGVYLGGGIAPRILQRLKQPIFLKAFFDKGRMRHLMEAIPVKVILNDRAALLGAARYAAIQ